MTDFLRGVLYFLFMFGGAGFAIAIWKGLLASEPYGLWDMVTLAACMGAVGYFLARLMNRYHKARYGK